MLSCFRNFSGHKSEKVKKKLCKLFKQSGLSITVELNLQITDFLDITFDLRTHKYYPYRKNNHQLLYINKQLNHSSTITKQMPSMVNRRIYLINLAINNTSIKLHPPIIMLLQLLTTMKILNSRQQPHQEGTVTERSKGSVHHIVLT